VKRSFFVLLAAGSFLAVIGIQGSQLSSRVRPGFVFSTFLGGAQLRQSRGEAIAVDGNRGVIVVGRTQADDFPSRNAAQKKFGGGENDAFITKYQADGQKILYSTYLGGQDVDFAQDVAVDSEGNAYVAGTTYSKDFPTMEAAQRSYGGGDRDCFVAKLSRDGVLLYSTLLGGDATDRCTAIAVDSEGNAYVTGSTNSQNWMTSKVMTPIGSKKDWDAFVVKLNPSGARKVYNVRFGGTAGSEPKPGGFGGESGVGISVHSTGTAYVIGYTDSQDFPSFPTLPAGMNVGGGEIAGFVVSIDSTGSLAIGNGSLWPGYSFADVALDSTENVYVIGRSRSFTAQGPAPYGRPYVMRLRSAPGGRGGFQSSRPTSVSTDNNDTVSDLAIDAQGNVYVIGSTRSVNFTTTNALQTQLGNQSSPTLNFPDAFVTILDPNSGSVLMSTYLGGSGFDEGLGIDTDNSGNVYVTGVSGYGGGGSWKEFPTVRAPQSDRRTTAAFVAKIGLNAGRPAER